MDRLIKMHLAKYRPVKNKSDTLGAGSRTTPGPRLRSKDHHFIVFPQNCTVIKTPGGANNRADTKPLPGFPEIRTVKIPNDGYIGIK